MEKTNGLGTYVVLAVMLWFCCGLLYKSHVQKRKPAQPIVAYLASPLLVLWWCVEKAICWLDSAIDIHKLRCGFNRTKAQKEAR